MWGKGRALTFTGRLKVRFYRPYFPGGHLNMRGVSIFSSSLTYLPHPFVEYLFSTASSSGDDFSAF